jgi:hypothetical protein
MVVEGTTSKKEETKVLYSKIKDLTWPRLDFILSKVAESVTKGNLVVQLYDADEKKILDEERPLRFDKLKVTLTLEFTNSNASKNLKEDLACIEAKKQEEQYMNRSVIL